MSRVSKKMSLALLVILSILLGTSMAFRFPILAPGRAHVLAPTFATAVERADRLDYPLNRLFDDDFFRFPPSLLPTWKTRASEMTPALSTFKVDVTENDKGYVVNCDLPGMSKEDIKVKHEGDVLMITCERKDTKEEKDETRHVTEISYGKFYRSFCLPNDADSDKIAATMDKGVLHIHIPKAEAKVEKEKLVEVREA